MIYLIFTIKLVYFTYKLMDNLKRYQICHHLITYFATLIFPKKNYLDLKFRNGGSSKFTPKNSFLIPTTLLANFFFHKVASLSNKFCINYGRRKGWSCNFDKKVAWMSLWKTRICIYSEWRWFCSTLINKKVNFLPTQIWKSGYELKRLLLIGSK